MDIVLPEEEISEEEWKEIKEVEEEIEMGKHISVEEVRKRALLENEYALLPTKKIKNLVRRHSGKLSLDAGCGKGVYLDSFNGSVAALDVTLPLLKEAKKLADTLSKEDAFFIHGDVRFLPFRCGVFDFVLCSEVIEHLQEDEAKRAFSEFERVVNGVIQIDTPNANLFNQFARSILFRHEDVLTTYSDTSPLRHHSMWTTKKLKSEGLKVKGCLGWVTRRRIKLDFIGDLYDLLFWNLPSIAGTLIGIKYVFHGEKEN